MSFTVARSHAAQRCPACRVPIERGQLIVSHYDEGASFANSTRHLACVTNAYGRKLLRSVDNDVSKLRGMEDLSDGEVEVPQGLLPLGSLPTHARIRSLCTCE